jgi:hypothetical protein
MTLLCTAGISRLNKDCRFRRRALVNVYIVLGSRREQRRKGEAACPVLYRCAAYVTPVSKAEFLKFATSNPWSDGIYTRTVGLNTAQDIGVRPFFLFCLGTRSCDEPITSSKTSYEMSNRLNETETTDSTPIAVFWALTSCGPVGVHQHFGRTQLKMETVGSSEMLVPIYKSTRRKSPEDHYRYFHCRENFRSHTDNMWFPER